MQSPEHSEIDRRPSTSDPQELIDTFLRSPYYQSAYEEFYRGKTINPSVTEEKKHSIFQRADIVRQRLIEFSQKEFRFTFDPSSYPPEVHEALNGYMESARNLKKAYQDYDRDKIQTEDSYRAAAHSALADRLYKAHLTPTPTIGLGIASLVLVDSHLETYDSIKKSRTGRT